MRKVLEGLKYSETHEWVKVEGDIAVIGVTDFAQKEMGAITYVDCPDVDDELEKGEEFGALESVKDIQAMLRLVESLISTLCIHLKQLKLMYVHLFQAKLLLLVLIRLKL